MKSIAPKLSKSGLRTFFGCLGAQSQTTPPPLPEFFPDFFKKNFEKIFFFKNYEKIFYPSDPSGYIPDNIWNISDTFWKICKNT